MEKKRSVGIKIIGILVIFVGIICMLNFIRINFFMMKFNVRNIDYWGLVKFALFIIAGIGIFFQRDWARMLTLLLSFLCLINFLFLLMEYGKSVPKMHYYTFHFLINSVLPSFVSIFSIIYLSRPEVKEQFYGRGNTEKKMSAGVIVISIILLIYSLWLVGFFVNFLVLVGYRLFGSINPPYLYFPELVRGEIVLFLKSVTGLIYLIASINILRLKNWARIITVRLSRLVIFVAVIFVGVNLFSIGQYAILLLIHLLPIIMISLLFMIFFTRPKVKEQFE